MGMPFKRTSIYRCKVKLSIWLVAVFAATTLFGPLVHASMGDGIEVIGDNPSEFISVDFHENDHGHSHSHSHDDDLSDEVGEQHSHKHNPADHSHEVSAVAIFIGSDLSIIPMNDYQPFAAGVFIQVAFNIDRPPRV